MTSQTFAGWVVNGEDGGFNMKTTVVLPRLKCGKTNQAIVPSVGAYFAPSRKGFSDAGIFVGCSGGKARYYPAFRLHGKEKDYPTLKARAGDTVNLSIQMGGKHTRLSVQDTTTKSASKNLSGGGVSAVAFPWTGDLGWPTSSLTPQGVPDFGTVTFSNTLFIGAPLGKFSELEQFNRYDGSTLQISTTGFKSHPTKFKTGFHHS